MHKPKPTDYPGFFNAYIELVPEDTILEAFYKQTNVIQHFLLSISEEQSDFRYAPGKWTIKEVLQHLTDAERIFSYRALCLARKEKLPLTNFDENEYAANSGANKRAWKSLANEFLIARQSTLSLFTSFNNTMLLAEGTTSNYRTSVTTIGFVIVGHWYHHIKVIKERYHE
jgi:DinB family protein